MSEAIAALLGAFIGGGMVVLGDVLARRSEDRRRWLDRLHEASSELIHYEWHREVVVGDSRRTVGDVGSDLEARFGQERRLAAAKIWTLPGASDAREDMKALLASTNRLTDSASSEQIEYEQRRDEYFEALRRFQKTIQHTLEAS